MEITVVLMLLSLVALYLHGSSEEKKNGILEKKLRDMEGKISDVLGVVKGELHINGQLGGKEAREVLKMLEKIVNPSRPQPLSTNKN
ncbi:MAG: hypothetical protein CEN90_35 [Parcubacteria group bacterium Licking1014_17]|nr:MAG: hypothetical protein CEN90_35 [Parcubacteria group bacterium Licking1014_17]